MASSLQAALKAFKRLGASVLMPGLPTPSGLLNLLPASDPASSSWSFFNVSGTATRNGRLLTFGASGIDRIIKSGGGLILTQGVQYTCAVKLSGSGVVRLFFVDGQGSTFLASTITLTSAPTYYTGVRVATATGSSGGMGVYGNGEPATLTVHETGIFEGNVTEAQIIANGGIPETQTSAEAFFYNSAVPALPYRTYIDSTFMDMMEAVTQEDQPVGGVLDSARAAPEVVQVLSNPDFTKGGEGWGVTSTDATHVVTFANGAMRYQSDTTTPVLQLEQAGRLSVFCMYRITGHVSAVNDNHAVHPAGRLKSDALGGVAFARTTGPFDVMGVATSTTFSFTRNTANVDVTLDWIKCEPVLAKSLGPNLVANGGFDSDSGWVKGAGWSIVDGKASKVAGAEGNLSQAITGLDQNKVYEVGIKHSVQAGVLYIRFGSLTTNYGTFLVDGEQTMILRPNGNATIYIYGNASFVGWVDDITVREVTDSTGTDYVTDRNSETRAITVPLDTLTGFSSKGRSSDVARSGGFSTKLTSVSGSRLHYWNVRTVPAGVGITVSGWVYAPAAIAQALRAVDVADGSFIQQIAAASDLGRWVYFQFTRPAKATQWTLAFGQNSVGDWGTNSIYFDDLSITDAAGEIATQATTASKPTARRGIVNRVLNSDGGVGTYVSNGVTTAATPIAGRAASIQFPAAATTATAYKSITLVSGRLYTLAFYAQMDDNSAPLVPNSSTSGDFAVQVNNSFAGADSVTQVAPGIYLVVKSFVSNAYSTSGVVRYASQSGKGFRISGMGVFEGALSALQVIAAGGVPSTTTTAASSYMGVSHLLSPSIVINGDFSNGLTGWTPINTGTGACSLSGGSAVLVAPLSGDMARLRQSVPTVVGRSYEVSVNSLVNPNAGSLLMFGTTGGGSDYFSISQSLAPVKYVFVATSAVLWISAYHSTVGASFSFGGVSVREVTGAKTFHGQHYEFDGVNDLLTYGRAVLSQAADNWVCAAFELTAAPAAQGAVFSTSNSASVPPRVAYLYLNSDRRVSCMWRDDANNLQLLTSAAPLMLSTRYVVSARRVGNTASLFVNGVQVASSAVALGATAVNTSSVGALFSTAAQSFFAGDIYHLSFSQSTLTESDRKKIEAFAALQAGVQL